MVLEIKRNKKKEELRSDPVMESILSARAWVVKNSNAVLSFSAAVLIVIAGYSVYASLKGSSAKSAQEAFGQAVLTLSHGDQASSEEALRLIVEKNANTLPAAYSAFMLGHLHLDKGEIDAAAERFEVAAGMRQRSFVTVESYEGLSICAEKRGDLQGAIDYLQTAAKSKYATYKLPELRWKMALLSKELGKSSDVRIYCEKILNDTLAVEYQQKAKNLLCES